MQSVSNLKKSLNQLTEKLDFYEKIINKLPALIYINELTKRDDISTLKNIWSNKWAIDFIGYKQEEITAMGYDFVKLVFHPDDLDLPPQSLELSKKNANSIYYSLSRQKPKDNGKYQWLYSRTIAFDNFPDGSPKQSLNVAFELHNEIQSAHQVVSLLNEINQLKNEIKLNVLSVREKEIIHLIAKGHTDKEISAKLNISVKTAKTHRNKILKKLGLKNSASVVALAVECGL